MRDSNSATLEDVSRFVAASKTDWCVGAPFLFGDADNLFSCCEAVDRNQKKKKKKGVSVLSQSLENHMHQTNV